VSILIKGGELINPESGTIEQSDILVERGKISKILPRGTIEEQGPRLTTINATEKLVVPGLIDMHVHLREPGEEYKESIATGTMAAVAGGYTSVACMPNTKPPNDCRSVTEFILRRARGAGLARVYPIASITMGQKGLVLSEFGDLREAGAVAVSEDGYSVVDSELMRRAMEYARYHGLAVICHCEDRSLSEGGVMHEGVVSTRIGLPGIPAASEEIMVFREICLARLTGTPVHIAHVSTKGSVSLIRKAKEEGILVTAETAPHYFALDHHALMGYDTRFKVNPPLRTPADVQAVRQGLADGVIDVIATDHAPHSAIEKDVEFDRAAFGMIGLETALPMTLSLVREGVLGMVEAFRKMTCNPAGILGIQGGGIKEGAPADLAVIDADIEYVLSEEDFHSRSKNSPFIGMPLKGRNDLTMIGGRIVWQESGKHTGC
jgi:dihydroorotase